MTGAPRLANADCQGRAPSRPPSDPVGQRAASVLARLTDGRGRVRAAVYTDLLKSIAVQGLCPVRCRAGRCRHLPPGLSGSRLAASLAMACCPFLSQGEHQACGLKEAPVHASIAIDCPALRVAARQNGEAGIDQDLAPAGALLQLGREAKPARRSALSGSPGRTAWTR